MWHERPFPVEALEGLPFRQVYVLSISLSSHLASPALPREVTLAAHN